MKHGKEEYYGEKRKKTFFWYNGAQAKHLAEDVEAEDADSDGSIANGDPDYF